jgi:phosphonate transport system ATP-binding protein
MNSTYIHAQELTCNVSGSTILAIDNLNIKQGERIAILGHNGAGKSTFFKLVSGFMQISSGKLNVLDHHLENNLSAIHLRSLRKEIGQILQGLHLVSRLSTLDNVLIGCLGRISGWQSILGYYSDSDIELAHQALDAVGLQDHACKRVDKLSGGERQRIAIARMLMQQPKLILADEPTAALDPGAALDMCDLLIKSAKNSTLITIVHNTALLPYLADRVLGFKSGGIVFDLPVREVDKEIINQLYEN